MSIKIIPYEPVHAYTILEKNVRERDLWLSAFPDWDKVATVWKEDGPADTIMFENNPVCSYGIILMSWDRGELWSLLSSLFYTHWRECFKIFKRRLSETIKDFKLVRVQTLVFPDYPDAARLVEHLGFKEEGLLRKYGPNHEDLFMYARLADETH